jgi:L-fucose mutarotase
MAKVDVDKDLNVEVWPQYEQILKKTQDKPVQIEYVERFAFYERAKKAYAIIQVGDNAKYGNIILKKGLALE